MTDTENLLRLIGLVKIKLDEAKAEEGEFDAKDYTAWRKRVDAAMRKVMAFFTSEEDARFTSRSSSECAVKMAGIRSTSTSGWTSALHNWNTAARKQVDAVMGVERRFPSPYSPEAGLRGGLGRDDLGDPINLQGSGPAPIEPREG